MEASLRGGGNSSWEILCSHSISLLQATSSTFQLHITASIREWLLRATKAAPVLLEADVREPTLLIVTERGLTHALTLVDLKIRAN